MTRDYKHLLTAVYAARMACEGCGGKDFTAVPTSALTDLTSAAHDTAWAVLGLWCALILVVWALLRKGVLTAADLLPGLAHG